MLAQNSDKYCTQMSCVYCRVHRYVMGLDRACLPTDFIDVGIGILRKNYIAVQFVRSLTRL